MSEHLYTSNKKVVLFQGEPVWAKIQEFPTAKCIWSSVHFTFSRPLSFDDIFMLFPWDTKLVKGNSIWLEIENTQGKMKITLPRKIIITGVTHSSELKTWHSVLHKFTELGGSFVPHQTAHRSPFADFHGFVKQLTYTCYIGHTIDLVKLFMEYKNRQLRFEYGPRTTLIWNLEGVVDILKISFNGFFSWNTFYPLNIVRLGHIFALLRKFPLEKGMLTDQETTKNRVIELLKN